MKRFKFRLGRVLAIRQIRERIAEAELGQARLRFAQEQNRLSQMNGLVEQGIINFRSELQSGFDPSVVITHHLYIERLKGEAGQQVVRVDTARQEVSRRQDVLVHARQERKALDKLRERQHQSHFRFSLLDEQKVLDDIRRAERR